MRHADQIQLDCELLLDALFEARSRIDGPEHQALRHQRGARSPNPKTGTPNVGGRPIIETLPLEDLLTVGRYNIVELSLATDTPIEVLKGMRRHGVPVRAADRLATRIGYHPASVWGPQVYEMGAA